MANISISTAFNLPSWVDHCGQLSASEDLNHGQVCFMTSDGECFAAVERFALEIEALRFLGE